MGKKIVVKSIGSKQNKHRLWEAGARVGSLAPPVTRHMTLTFSCFSFGSRG